SRGNGSRSSGSSKKPLSCPPSCASFGAGAPPRSTPGSALAPRNAAHDPIPPRKLAVAFGGRGGLFSGHLSSPTRDRCLRRLGEAFRFLHVRRFRPARVHRARRRVRLRRL